MTVDKIDKIFNSLGEIDDTLKMLSSQVYLKRASMSTNKASSLISAVSGGVLGISSLLLGLNLDRVQVLEVMSIMGLYYAAKLRRPFANTNFGKLVETPLSFEVWDKIADKKMDQADVASYGIDIPDPVKFYELTTSDILLKTKNQKYPGSAYTSVDKKSGMWKNIEPNQYGLVFDDKSKEVIKKIIAEYQNPKVKSTIYKYAPDVLVLVSAGIFEALSKGSGKKTDKNKINRSTITISPADIGSAKSSQPKTTKPSIFNAKGKDILKGL